MGEINSLILLFSPHLNLSKDIILSILHESNNFKSNAYYQNVNFSICLRVNNYLIYFKKIGLFSLLSTVEAL